MISPVSASSEPCCPWAGTATSSSPGSRTVCSRTTPCFPGPASAWTCAAPHFYCATWGAWKRPRVWGAFWLEYAVNTGLGSKNDDINYTVNRIGAKEDWDALRYGGDLDLLLPKNWRLNARLLGQASADPLIPGEQFGLGGMRSVRGYEEREISADSAEQVNLEILTPPIYKNLRLAGFADLGWSHLQEPHPGRDGNDFIAGTGLGLRWYWKDWVSLALDGAVALEDAVETEAGDVKGNFNLFLRY